MRMLIFSLAAVALAGSAQAQAPGAAQGAAAQVAAPAPASPITPASAQAPASGAPAAPAGQGGAAASTGWRTLDPANALLIETTKGRMIMELRPDLAPLAVARIKTLTRRGYYDNNLFYRVIDKFMDQTGDKGTKQFKSDLPNLKAEFTFSGKPAEYASVGDIPGGDVGFVGSTPVRLDTPAGGAVTGWIQYCPGVAAMPHYDDPNTANSQMFILRDPSPGVEKKYTAFGRVVVGVDVARSINVGEPPAHPDKMTRVRVLADIPAAERPQVQMLDPRSSAFSAVVQQTIQAKGPYFSLCDIETPTQVR